MQTLGMVMLVFFFILSLGYCSYHGLRFATVIYIKVITSFNQLTSLLRLSQFAEVPTPATASRILLISLIPTIPLVLVIQFAREGPLLRPFESGVAFLEVALIAAVIEFMSLAVVTHVQLPAKLGRAALISLGFTPLGTVLTCATLIMSVVTTMVYGVIAGGILAIYDGRDLSVP